MKHKGHPRNVPRHRPPIIQSHNHFQDKTSQAQRMGLWPKSGLIVHPHGEVSCSWKAICVIAVYVHVQKKDRKDGLQRESCDLFLFLHTAKHLEGCTLKWHHQRLGLGLGMGVIFFLFFRLSYLLDVLYCVQVIVTIFKNNVTPITEKIKAFTAITSEFIIRVCL